MEKHTPGPWKSGQYTPDGHLQPLVRVWGRNGELLADLPVNQNGHANASLMACSPEMLAVLELLEIQLAFKHAPDPATQEVMLKSVRAAVANAKGFPYEHSDYNKRHITELTTGGGVPS